MATELEIKMRVSDHTSIRQALIRHNAALISKHQELNTFFDRAEQSLLSKGSGLRIRSETPIDGGAPRTRVTFKGPRSAADAPRREVEFMASDYASAVELLEALGFAKILHFEKIRESWLLDQCEIELDELPILGRFVEIEGKELNVINNVRDKLGLANLPLVKEGYAEMMAKKS